MFEKGPCKVIEMYQEDEKITDTSTWTLNMSGEWTPVRTLSLSAMSLYLAHHTLAPLSQNSWGWV